MKKITFVLILLCFLFIFGTDEISAQCAMCRATVENADKENLAKGLNTGILYLMSIPYILVGLIAYFWYQNSKKYREQQNKLSSTFRAKMSEMQKRKDV